MLVVLLLLVGCAQPIPLTLVTPEDAGDSCEQGGVRIESGFDDNADGTLQPEEVSGSELICNGTNGRDGTDGTPGQDGAPGEDGIGGPPGRDGSDGAPGQDGLTALTDVRVTDDCPFEGLEIVTGLDDNGNGVLDPEEEDASELVCNDPAGFVEFAFDEGGLTTGALGDRVTLQQLTVDAPTSGKLMAIGSTSVFCSAPGTGAPDACSNNNPAADGCVFITDDPDAGCPSATSGEPHTFFFLDQEVSLAVTMVDVFEVEAGEHTLFLGGSNFGDRRPGELLFNRRQLTVVFIPEASTP